MIYYLSDDKLVRHCDDFTSRYIYIYIYIHVEASIGGKIEICSGKFKFRHGMKRLAYVLCSIRVVLWKKLCRLCILFRPLYFFEKSYTNLPLHVLDFLGWSNRYRLYLIERLSTFDSKIWDGFIFMLTALTSFTTVVVGEIANFAAYAFAPAVLVTPLGALSIIVR